MVDVAAPTSEVGRASPTLRQSGLLGGISWTTFGDIDEDVPDLRFPTSATTYRTMMRDSQVASLTLGLLGPIRRWERYLDPNGARDEVVAHVAEDLGVPILGMEDGQRPARTRDRFDLGEHMRLALRSALFGAAYFEQVARIDEQKRARLRKLAPRPLKTIKSFGIADDDGLESITQSVGGRDVQIPVSRLVAYVWDREPGSWLGESMLRPLYKHWVLKDRLVRIDAMRHERFGSPMPFAEAPENATPAQLEALDLMMQSVRAGERAGGAGPKGTKVHLIGASGGSGTDILGSLRYHDELMARAWASQVIQLGQTETGSRALGDTFAGLLHVAQETVLEHHLAVLNAHVIEDLVDWNFGTDERAPILRYRAPDPGRSVEDIVAAINAGLIRVDDELEAAIRQEMRLPRRDPDEPGRSAEVIELPSAAPIAATGRRMPQRGFLSRVVERMRGRRVRAAGVEDIDLSDLDDAWERITTDAVQQWRGVRAGQIDELVAAVEAAGGDVAELAAIAATPAGADVILSAMIDAATSGIDTARAEAIAQGVTPPKVTTEPLQDRLAAQADALAAVMARGLSQYAAETAVANAASSVVGDLVRANLEELTDAYPKRKLGSAVTGAQTEGRFEVMRAAGDDATRYYADETLDGNTCGPCRGIHGTEFASLEEAMAAYEGLGGYVECEGGDLCRGAVIAEYAEAEASR